jgi:pilus assembly protein Flp/PilA
LNPTTTPIASVKNKPLRRINMSILLKLQSLLRREDGQDLVEYALVVALIAFGAVAAMQGLATEINSAFNVISSDLGTAL